MTSSTVAFAFPLPSLVGAFAFSSLIMAMASCFCSSMSLLEPEDDATDRPARLIKELGEAMLETSRMPDTMTDTTYIWSDISKMIGCESMDIVSCK